MERIILNIIPTGVMPTCHVSEKDVGREIGIDLFDGALAYEIQSGDEVKLDMLKPNGENVSAILATNVGDTSVVISTVEQMTDVVGKCLCELKIMNGDKKIGSLNFYMEVEEAVGEVEPLPPPTPPEPSDPSFASMNIFSSNNYRITDIDYTMEVETV